LTRYGAKPESRSRLHLHACVWIPDRRWRGVRNDNGEFLRIAVALHALRETRLGVIAGHRRSKNGVASLAYDPAIHPFSKKMDARIKSAHDDE
jgi:hypothetical protein